jgi:hypothetical protein
VSPAAANRPSASGGAATARRLKVLILGGYGAFGGRLAELLSDEPRLTLVIAGRSKAKAQAFCARLHGAASQKAMSLDRDRALAAQLAEISPDVVVDASGPFQAYGEDPYRVAGAALAAGADYMDLADGADFVRNIARLDAAAKAAGRFVLSGVSSFPVLTAAAVRHLAADLAGVDSIAAGVAPLPYASVGRNVVRAIASYAGRPVLVRRDGRWDTAYPLTETRRYTIAPPGFVPLDRLTFSLVHVPDLELLPELWPAAQSVWVGAAPVPAIWHGLLRGLAHGVRRGLIPTLAPLAPLMYRTINVLRWGERRGGMFVEVEGRLDDGAVARRSWHLLAEGDDGPLIPSMAVEAIVRNMLEGRVPPPGARPATRELELADYERAFARRAIHCGERRSGPHHGNARRSREPLYRRILGDAWWQLPRSLRDLHGSPVTSSAAGRADVGGGAGWIARAIGRVFGFPAPTSDTEVRVTFERTEGRETWRRQFGSRRLTSVQYEGRGRYERLLCEQFGPFVFGMALVVEAQRLSYVVRRWSFLGMPLPRVLAPRGETFEREVDGLFHFHVEIETPLTGRIVTYSGHLR